MSQVILKHVRDFLPDHVFDCGQAFRWQREEDGSYTGIVGGRIANIRFDQQEENTGEGQLVLSNVSESEFSEFWKYYLDLDRDYREIQNVLAQEDPVMKAAIAFGRGIRILRQDPWETLISFLISQNNHIPRIRKCIETLCECFGKPAGTYRGRAFYSFPEPEALAELTAEDLAVCRLGYREQYLVKAARKVLEDGTRRLRDMSDPKISGEEAFSYITEFCGVGPKVANCILLFSLGKYDRFPVDVWVKKVMKNYYGLETPKEIAVFAEKKFGKYGGFAQQYLFYYIRESEQE